MKKPKYTKEDIINIAFIEWGKKNFISKSLSLITRKMNITKPALYRYFKNKEELFDSMKNHLISKLIEQHQLFMKEIKNKTPDEIIYILIKIQFTFFLNNYYYFLFYIFYLLKQDIFINNDTKKITHELNEVLKSILKKSTSWLKPENSNQALIFIFSTGFFFLLNAFYNETTNIKTFNDDKKNKIIDDIYLIVMNGFGNKNKCLDIDFSKIETLCLVNKIKINRDKIFEAIINVVAEEGLWDTTIGKIAKKLNMSKSNLYCYYKNKREMLQSMIIKEIETRLNLSNANLNLFDNHCEKIYSYIATLANYLLLNKKIMYVFDWLHIQNIDIKSYIKKNKIVLNDQFKSYMQILIDQNIINQYHFDSDFIYGFITIQIIKEIYFAELSKSEISPNNMRLVYNCFLKGINLGGRNA
jgi:AcrR family transcriptional regulator